MGILEQQVLSSLENESDRDNQRPIKKVLDKITGDIIQRLRISYAQGKIGSLIQLGELIYPEGALDGSASQAALLTTIAWYTHGSAQEKTLAAIVNGKEGDLVSSHLMNKFSSLMKPSEIILWNLLPTESNIATASSEHLRVASEHHDLAEYYDDIGSTEMGTTYWEKVEEFLTARAFVALADKDVRNNSDLLVKAKSAIESSTERYPGLLDQSKVIQFIEDATGNSIIDNNDSFAKFELAHTLAILERIEWQAHHEGPYKQRDYVTFEAVHSLILQLIGHNDQVASEATELLIDACKLHDNIETDNMTWRQKLSYAQENFKILNKYYSLLSSSNN